MKPMLKLSLHCLLIALAGFGSVMAQAPGSEKNDCVIVATEAYARLQKQGVWAEIVAFDINLPDGKKYRHAACIFQPSKTGNIQLYEANIGTFDLKTRSADLGTVEQGYNRYFNKGYSVSNFEVLIQEPMKAKAADSQPQPKPVKPITLAARTAARPRAKTAPTEQQLSQTELLLLESGFKDIKVTTAKQQQAVSDLPPGKISYMRYKGGLYYVFPAAAKNKLYVGRQAQVDAFTGVRPRALDLGRETSGPNWNYFNPGTSSQMAPTPPHLR